MQTQFFYIFKLHILKRKLTIQKLFLPKKRAIIQGLKLLHEMVGIQSLVNLSSAHLSTKIIIIVFF